MTPEISSTKSVGTGMTQAGILSNRLNPCRAPRHYVTTRSPARHPCRHWAIPKWGKPRMRTADRDARAAVNLETGKKEEEEKEANTELLAKNREIKEMIT